MVRILAISFFIAYSYLSIAQQPSYYRVGEEEFSGIDIYGLLQDQEGFIWICSNNGLFRYNGYEYQRFDHPEMKNQSVFNPKLDLNGTFYCNNLSGQFFKFQGDSLSLFYTLPDSLKSSNILFDFDDQNQMVISARNLYLKTRSDSLKVLLKLNGIQTNISKDTDGGLILYNLNSFEILKLKNGELTRPKFADTSSLHFPEFSPYLQFMRLDEKLYALNSYFTDFAIYVDEQWYQPNPKISAQERPVSLGLINEKGIWLAYQNKGARAYDLKGKARYNGEVLFPDYQLSAAIIDQEDNLWLGTIGKGILIIPDIDVVDFNNIPTIEEDDIKSITSAGNNTVFFSGFKGKIYKSQGLELKEIFQHDEKLEFIHYLEYDSSMLFNNHHGDFKSGKFTKTRRYSTSSIKDIHPLSKSEFLVATNMRAYLYSFAPFDSTYAKQFENYEKFGFYAVQDMLSFDVGRCHAISYDPQTKDIWIGTLNGLVVINENSFEQLEYDGKILGVIDIEIIGDEAWIATTKSGVLVFKNKKINRVISAGNGLPSSNIIGMKKYGNKLITSTDKGIQIKDLNTGTDQYLNKTNGLHSNRVLDFELVNDQLWMIFSNGIQRISINNRKINKVISRIYIEKISVNEKELTDLNKKEFDHNENKVEFQFVALAFRHRGELQYEYRLKGFEDNWNYTSFESNTAKYSALPSGDYVFEVRAINENGVRSNTATYTFSISPPFWTRWWFFLLCALLLISIVAVYFMIRISIIRKRLRLEKQIKASEVTAIKAQMNPHFVFNALNSVQDLILQNDIRESNIYLGKFADLMRKTLDYSSRDFISIEEEVNLLKIYLDLEKLRFGEDFKVIYKIDLSENELEYLLIPSMIIQPYVENALKHGLLHKDGQKLLTISFLRNTEYLQVEIQDNGIGRERAAAIKARREKVHNSFASEAIQKRIDLVNEMQEKKITLEIVDLQENGQPKGTLVIIKFPLKK
jgi:ligand-binding sensor domain-containing protein